MSTPSRTLALLAPLVLAALTGCGMFPTPKPLLPAADVLRTVSPRPAPLPRELAKTVLPAYRVEPGDILLVEPADFASEVLFPPDQTVLVDGTIDLGRYGRMIVAGQTVEEIEAAIVERLRYLAPDLEPADHEVNVRIITPQGAVYYVLGDVNAPGAFPLQGRETVLDGIIAAGGLADSGSGCKVILARPTSPRSCRVVLNICYHEIVQLGDTSTNYQLMPGDRIYVATKSLWEEVLAFTPWAPFCRHCQKRHCACRTIHGLPSDHPTYANPEWSPATPAPAQPEATPDLTDEPPPPFEDL